MQRPWGRSLLAQGGNSKEEQTREERKGQGVRSSGTSRPRTCPRRTIHSPLPCRRAPMLLMEIRVSLRSARASEMGVPLIPSLASLPLEDTSKCEGSAGPGLALERERPTCPSWGVPVPGRPVGTSSSDSAFEPHHCCPWPRPLTGEGPGGAQSPWGLLARATGSHTPTAGPRVGTWSGSRLWSLWLLGRSEMRRLACSLGRHPLHPRGHGVRLSQSVPPSPYSWQVARPPVCC